VTRGALRTSAGPAMPGQARPVLMIVHSYYEEDPRVRREAESLVATGRPVAVLGLRRPDGPTTSEVAGVRVHHLDVQRHQGAGLGVYLREYASFLVRAMFAAARLHRRERFALVQVHSLPDYLVLAALPLRLAGVPVLLDLHEAMPEFFRSRFPGASNPLVHRLLMLQERLSIAMSMAVITVNPAMRDRLVRLGVPAAKAGVVVNSPSLARFDIAAHPRRAFREDGRLRLIYTGALTPTYELDVAIAAVARVAAARPALDVAFEVYGRGDSGPALAAQAAELGIADRVTFHGRIAIEDVPAAVAGADIGLAPTRHDRFTDMSLSTKVFEYAAMGKPVVASRLPMVEQTFPPGTVAAYTPGDPEAMADAILAFADDPDARQAAVAATAEIVQAGSWEHEAKGYLALVERLIGSREGEGPAEGRAPSRGLRRQG
jgi:glycosyltransferase involved in cell wall biosynthesis